MELRQFDIKFQPRTAIKAQALAGFVAEFTPRSHHICLGDLTGATEMGMESAAGSAQPLTQYAQPHPKIDWSNDEQEEANHAAPGKNSAANKN